MNDLYRELFVSLGARDDIAAVRFAQGEIDVRPEPQTYESGRPAPEVLTLSIPRAPFERAYKELRGGAELAGTVLPSDIPELAAFALFHVHVEETLNSLNEPGPNGFKYTQNGFEPY